MTNTLLEISNLRNYSSRPILRKLHVRIDPFEVECFLTSINKNELPTKTKSDETNSDGE